MTSLLEGRDAAGLLELLLGLLGLLLAGRLLDGLGRRLHDLLRLLEAEAGDGAHDLAEKGAWWGCATGELGTRRARRVGGGRSPRAGPRAGDAGRPPQAALQRARAAAPRSWRTFSTAIFLSAANDSSTMSNSVFSSTAAPASAPPPAAPGAIIIMPPPPPADASTSKVSSIAFTSSEASSSVIDFSFSITSSTAALMATFATLDCASLEWLGVSAAPLKAAAADAQRASSRKRNMIARRGKERS